MLGFSEIRAKFLYGPASPLAYSPWRAVDRGHSSQALLQKWTFYSSVSRQAISTATSKGILTH